MKPPTYDQRAFTIVELLIVIVVIGILAAVTIVAYNGVQQRARASAASSALTQAAKKLAVYLVDNTSYPTDLATVGITDGEVSYQYSYNNTTIPRTFCITATSVNISYQITQNSSPTSGGCAGHGTGGQSAVTNVATNPSFETNTTGVSGPNGSTVSASTARFQSGASSIVATMPISGSSTVGANVFTGSSVPTSFKASTTYSYSAWVYVPTGTVNVQLSVQGTALAIWNCGGTCSTSVKDSWTRLSGTFTTGASGGIAPYVLNATATASAGTQFFVDSVMFTEGATLYNFGDGNSANWVWNGTANNSTSTGPAL